jgi:hypothetical protein
VFLGLSDVPPTSRLSNWFKLLQGRSVLQETVPDRSMEQIPASIVPPSEESCDTIPRPASTHTCMGLHDPLYIGDIVA